MRDENYLKSWEFDSLTHPVLFSHLVSEEGNEAEKNAYNYIIFVPFSYKSQG